MIDAGSEVLLYALVVIIIAMAFVVAFLHLEIRRVEWTVQEIAARLVKLEPPAEHAPDEG